MYVLDEYDYTIVDSSHNKLSLQFVLHCTTYDTNRFNDVNNRLTAVKICAHYSNSIETVSKFLSMPIDALGLQCLLLS